MWKELITLAKSIKIRKIPSNSQKKLQDIKSLKELWKDNYVSWQVKKCLTNCRKSSTGSFKKYRNNILQKKNERRKIPQNTKIVIWMEINLAIQLINQVRCGDLACFLIS